MIRNQNYIVGTANQITANQPTGQVTLSTPQDIHTGATPQFAGLGIGTAASSGNIEIAAGGKLLPDSDSTTALGIADAGGTNIVTIDTTTGLVGIGTTPAALLHLGGTYTVPSGAANLVNVASTIASSNTNQIAIQSLSSSVNPTGASLTSIYGAIYLPKVNASALTITNVYAFFARVDTSASFTGTITTGYGFASGNPNINAANTVTNYIGIFSAAQTKGTNNVGLMVGEATGTKNANVIIGSTTIPTGSWSIHNSSADPNYFAGPFLLEDSAEPTIGSNQAAIYGEDDGGTVRVYAASEGGVHALLSYYTAANDGATTTCTLGQTGNNGPATAAQNIWLKMSVDGTAYWVPAWV